MSMVYNYINLSILSTTSNNHCPYSNLVQVATWHGQFVVTTVLYTYSISAVTETSSYKVNCGTIAKGVSGPKTTYH